MTRSGVRSPSAPPIFPKPVDFCQLAEICGFSCLFAAPMCNIEALKTRKICQNRHMSLNGRAAETSIAAGASRRRCCVSGRDDDFRDANCLLIFALPLTVLLCMRRLNGQFQRRAGKKKDSKLPASGRCAAGSITAHHCQSLANPIQGVIPVERGRPG